MTANVYVHGDLNAAGSFREDDRYILKTPRLLTKINTYLDKVPIDIEVHFVHRKMPKDQYMEDTHFYSDNVGLLSAKQIKDFYFIDIPKRPSVVTVVLVENEARQRSPLTPWMVIHRLSHALIIRQNKAHDTYWHFVNAVSNATTRYKSNGKHVANDQDMIHMFGTTKAARTDTCREIAEWYHDSFVQFCLTGNVSFKAASHEATLHGKKIYLKLPYTTDQVDFLFYELASDLRIKFQNLLDKTRGAIVVL